MTKYRVTETCVYEVEADSAEEAEQIVADAILGVEDGSEVSFIGVMEREAEEVD